MYDGIGGVISQHEFGNPCLAFVFVVAAAVFCGEHYEVTNLIEVLWCPVSFAWYAWQILVVSKLSCAS